MSDLTFDEFTDEELDPGYIPPEHEVSLTELLTDIRDELRIANGHLAQISSTVNRSTTMPQIRTVCSSR